MLQLLGEVLPFAIPVALSPLPVIAVLMVLMGPAGTRGGLGFLLGRMATLAATGFVVALLARRLAGASGGGERSGWVAIGLGLLLAALAAVVWRKRPRGAEPVVPAWMRSLEQASPAGAARFGALLTVVNVKELALVIGAGTIIGGFGLSAGHELTLAVAFAAFAGLGVALPVALAQLAGDAARRPLAVLRDWLVRNQTAVVVVVLLVLAAVLLRGGIRAL